MNDNRLRVETAISLMESSNKNEIDRLKVAFGNYNIAKKNCEPFIKDLRTGMDSINRAFKGAGLAKPFVLSFDDMEKDLTERKANIKDLEAQRDAAREEYMGIEAETKKYPGISYGEVKEKQEESRKKWDELNAKVDEAWRSFRKAEDEVKNTKPSDFNAKCYTYKYLMNAILGKKDEIASTYVRDERTTNMIKVQLYSLGLSLESLRGKFEILNDSVKVFKEIGEKLGIDLVYDSTQAEIYNFANDITEKVDAVKEENAEEKTEERQEETPSLDTTYEKIMEPIKAEEDAPKVESEEEIKEEDNISEKSVDEVKDLESNEEYDFPELPDDIKHTIKQNNKTLDEKIPLGQRFKVTHIRAAKIGKAVASGLMVGAISGFVLASWTLPPLAIGAGLGIGIQALHQVFVDRGAKPIEKLDEAVKSYDPSKKASSFWICALGQSVKSLALKYKPSKEKNVNETSKSDSLMDSNMMNDMKSLQAAVEQERPLTPDMMFDGNEELGEGRGR